MPGEIDLPDLPDPGSLRRGRFTYLPVAPGRLEFAIEVRQAILRDRPQVVALELPVTLQQHYDARGGAAAGDVADLLSRRTARERRARHLRAGRAGRSVHRSHPHAASKSAPSGLRRPGLRRAAALEGRLPGPLRHPPHRLEKYVEAYRVYPQERSDEIARHAGGIAWKLQGCDPWRACWWWFR
jgi:hypothetical protein